MAGRSQKPDLKDLWRLIWPWLLGCWPGPETCRSRLWAAPASIPGMQAPQQNMILPSKYD